MEQLPKQVCGAVRTWWCVSGVIPLRYQVSTLVFAVYTLKAARARSFAEGCGADAWQAGQMFIQQNQ